MGRDTPPALSVLAVQNVGVPPLGRSGVRRSRSETEDGHEFDPDETSWDDVPYSRRVRSLSAFPITETELKLIAALASIGLSERPRNG